MRCLLTTNKTPYQVNADIYYFVSYITQHVTVMTEPPSGRLQFSRKWSIPDDGSIRTETCWRMYGTNSR